MSRSMLDASIMLSGPTKYQDNLLIAGINPLSRNLTYKDGLKLTEM